MSLGSVLQTALSGMSAATATFDAASHNLANMNSNGFKASYPVFAAQAPAAGRLGGSSVQIGLGVRVVGYETDESPGPQVVEFSGDAAYSTDGIVELSNTDVGGELIGTILASTQFRASANVFTSASGLLDELILLGRR